MLSIVPLSGVPNHTFTTTIYVDETNIKLTLTTTYNEIAGYWVLDIGDSEGTLLVTCIPLIPGYNILEQYAYLEIGAAYIVPKQKVQEVWPDYDTLTSNWYLIWGNTAGDDVS
ncbi:hypothetical protein AB840_11215 [Megasphaera cerevisiae DSM 20462]|uniref:Cyanophage baseplate Pam3 plug gp18 domain-containing protein n=1 Tax=Megasphaera cerevisiae DSM 20462 TaxID=1122219 RepID=A0A0J6WQW4_9FIRM|nr:hypothetical protein [Megasphaera cerevisiae]KMO85840.1 hypothetical protein AB840_11215 [Megasphaera cerevisiae DSM 20462]SJZ58535.1 hypothetical protein SAMN05660900_00848 [Megasphaera cerevisiae DSM 20462]